tara:strand:+ start:117 stop:653 length:537 start_codon:yes stop_codon:yes gene_type:complete
MKFVKTDFDGLIIIKHDVIHDNRGFFKEKVKLKLLENHINSKFDFCQENCVKSKLNVLRGLHFQEEPYAQSKLISLSYGKILDVVVDIRRDSSTYGKYFSYILSFENHESLLVPKGFAHGYLTISDFAIVNYCVDNYYNPAVEGGISYDDDYLNIQWGIGKEKLIISEKDKNHKPYKW